MNKQNDGLSRPHKKIFKKRVSADGDPNLILSKFSTLVELLSNSTLGRSILNHRAANLNFPNATQDKLVELIINKLSEFTKA